MRIKGRPAKVMKCPKCFKVDFHSARIYGKHVRRCFMEKRFVCFICLKKFLHKETMNRHIRGQHVMKALRYEPTLNSFLEDGMPNYSIFGVLEPSIRYEFSDFKVIFWYYNTSEQCNTDPRQL